MRIQIISSIFILLLLFGCGGRVIIDDEEENETNETIDVNQTPPLPADADNEGGEEQPLVVIKKTLCDDPDGEDISTKSVVVMDTKQFEDVCTGPKNLREYSCKGDEEVSAIFECPNAHECKNGACVRIPQSCKDTDDKNTNISGVVTINNGTGFVDEYIDSCANMNQVKEYYCDGNKEAFVLLDCPSDVTCDSGACTFKK